VPIIRRNKSIYVTLGTCYSVWMTAWYAGWNEADDGHTVARNMYRKEINVLRKMCAPSWLYLQDCTGVYGQRNIKFGVNTTEIFKCKFLNIFPRLYL